MSVCRRLIPCLLFVPLAAQALGTTPKDRTVYDSWMADIQYERASAQRAKEWERRSQQSGYKDYSADLAALNQQSRLQAQWASEEAEAAARRARREAAIRAREEEKRALLALYDAAEAGNADAQMQLAQRDESSAFGKWGIPRYQMVFGPRRPEALWRVVELLRRHAGEPEQLTSFRPVESFLGELAAGGDVRAAREAGEFWRAREDPFRAARFFAQAAEAGDISSQREALRLLATDRVDAVPAEPAAVLAWAKASAQRGEAFGQYWLGRMLCQGADVARNASEGVTWLRRAAAPLKDTTDADLATVRLRAAELAGLVLRDGAGVPADAPAGVELLRMAADAGSESARFALGQTYLLGLGVPASFEEALPWLRAAAKTDSGPAAALLATAYLRPDASEEEILEGLFWLKCVAKRRPEAMLAYGRILYAGEFGVEPDVSEALRYFGLAIEHYPKDAGVLDFLGDAYVHGSFGLQANATEGKRLLEQAAAAGSSRAAQRLAALKL